MSGNYEQALILGGSGGIGTEICRRFSQRGIPPIIVDKATSDQNAYPYYKCDVTDPEATRRTMKAIAERSDGNIHYVVSSIGRFDAYDDGVFDEHRLQTMMDSNVGGPLLALSEWYRYFGENGGSVAIVSSAAARRASTDVSYAISKAALEAATRCLARAWAPSRVWVFGVAPGLVTTRMADAMSTERRKRLTERSLIQRESTAEEVAELIVALLLSSPALLAGTTLDASGGLQ